MSRLSVVISQGQSQNPLKRQLEEDLVATLMMEPGVDVTVIPHLYDLSTDATGILALQGISGDLAVLSWLYERAARWVLDRNAICGQTGGCLINAEMDDEDEDEPLEDDLEEKPRVADDREVLSRKIYCIELSNGKSAEEILSEVRRIAKEAATQVVDLTRWVNGDPSKAGLKRFARPTNDTAVGLATPQNDPFPTTTDVHHVEDAPGRRWYPVIDFSRCTNCMECIDFCLFGVYGVDAAETILVEQPDNCRKGCPACSRVCPENAIIFPQHKTPAIAGAPAEVGGLKIDLSRLFGAPDAVEIAARERDEQLILAGREAVGTSRGIPKRQAHRSPDEPKDELDSLIDGLDELDR